MAYGYKCKINSIQLSIPETCSQPRHKTYIQKIILFRKKEAALCPSVERILYFQVKLTISTSAFMSFKLMTPATLVNVTVLTPYLDTGVTWSSVEERRITTITGPLSSMRTPDHPPCTQIADPIPETQTSR